MRWSTAERAALELRGFSADAQARILAELEQIEREDYPLWHLSITIDGCFRAVYTLTGGRHAGEAFEADSPLELRRKLARYYAHSIHARPTERNTR